MDCRNSSWSLQPTHLNGVERDTQDTSQKVHAERVGCALPQQEWSKIARDCSLCSKLQKQNPRSLAAMPGTPNRAQQGLAAALSKLRGNHYLRQLITVGIFQTHSNNLGADCTANQAVQSLWAARGVVYRQEISIFSAFSHPCVPFRLYKLTGVICFL